MRIEQLSIVIEVARYGSISLASKKLHISQPTISQAISALEKELGVRIFQRSRFGTVPTKRGKLIIEKANEILEKVEEIKRLSANNDHFMTGNLIMASIPSLSMTILSKTLAQFSQDYPEVNIKIHQDLSSRIEEKVKNDKIPLGFVAKESKVLSTNKDLIFQPLITGKVMACVGKKSPLSSSKQISFQELVKHPIISFIQHSPFSQKVLKELKQFGTPRIIFNAQDNENTGKQLLAEGIGVSFCSTIILKSDPFFLSGKLKAIPISETTIDIYYGYVKCKSKQLSRAANEFLKLLRKKIKEEDTISNY